jgi:hypothetical protein
VEEHFLADEELDCAVSGGVLRDALVMKRKSAMNVIASFSSTHSGSQVASMVI